MNDRIVSGLVGLALAAALAGTAAAAPVFPVKPSGDGRYLVDQNNTPFMIVGDAPQAMVGNLSVKKAAVFMKDRARYGINALWVNLLCDSYTACNSDGTTFDGIAPFTTPGDLSTPNPAYFDRAAQMVQAAAQYGQVVFLDPAETGGWLGALEANGTTKAYAYGQFLGNRFKAYPNIVWMSGNDFQSWQNASDDAVVVAVAKGIQSVDPAHLHTIELNYYVSASLIDPTWRPVAGLDAVYTYRPTYAQELSEYTRPVFKPTFLVEANYEFEQNGGTDGGSTPNLRHQEYWTALSGTTGQLYASAWSWRLQGDWRNNLDTIGILQFSYLRKLFESLPWYDLVPDHAHTVMTAGYGTFSKTDSITTDTYATAASTPDGTLAMAYLPSLRTVSVDMSKLSGKVRARWFDPTDATFSSVAGSPFANSGTRTFTPPGPNNGGDQDWLLVLQAK